MTKPRDFSSSTCNESFYFIRLLIFASILSAEASVLRCADLESGTLNVLSEDGNFLDLLGFEKDVIEHIAKHLERRTEFH
jgi:hypothetical protein